MGGSSTGNSQVTVEQLADWTVFIVPSTGEPLRGRLTDLSITGGQIRVGRGQPIEMRALAAHERVALHLEHAQLDKPIRAPAVITTCKDEPFGVRCAFQFVDPDTFQERLSSKLDELLEARAGERVTPPPDEPVDVRVLLPSSGGRTTVSRVALNDISPVGVSIDVDIEAADRLEQAGAFRLVVSIPSLPNKLELHGRVRHRLPLGNRWRLGVEFDAEATPRFALQRAQLATYVADQLAR
jgi:hypothetical protein